jgi:hypothetical protein
VQTFLVWMPETGFSRKRSWMLLPVEREDKPRKDVMPLEDDMTSEPLSEQATADGNPQLQHAASSICDTYMTTSVFRSMTRT